MADKIYYRSGEFSSKSFNKTLDDLKKAGEALNSLLSYGAVANAAFISDGYRQSLFSEFVKGEVASLERQIESAETKLESYMTILDSGPQALKSIDETSKISKIGEVGSRVIDAATLLAGTTNAFCDSLFRNGEYKTNLKTSISGDSGLLYGMSINDLSSDFKTLSDVMDWIDENYSQLPDVEKQLIKSACKKMFGNGVSAYEIVHKMMDGDYFGVIWESIGAVAPSSFDWKDGIGWKGLKLKAVSTVGKMVTDSNGYIQKNDEKYQNMMMDDLKNGDILGFVWDSAGSLVQTVGKGSVDGTCKLVSGAIDSFTEKLTEDLFGYGISLSTANALMYDQFGWSPGHAFNKVGKFVSNCTDTIIDGGSHFLSAVADQAYSDLKDFGELVGNATSATIDFLGNAADSVVDFFRK